MSRSERLKAAARECRQPCGCRSAYVHDYGCAKYTLAPDNLRDALRVHHPIMRSETGPFSGCRCGQVRLGQDVIAHVVAELRAADPVVQRVEALAEEWDAQAKRHDDAEPIDSDGLTRAILSARWCRTHAADLRRAIAGTTGEEGT